MEKQHVSPSGAFNWKLKSGLLEISEQTGKDLVAFAFQFVGFLMLVGGIVGATFVVGMGIPLATLIICGFFAGMGLLFLNTISDHQNKKKPISIHFDSNTEEVSFSRKAGGLKYGFTYGELKSILIEKDKRQSQRGSGSTPGRYTYYVYNIYLIKKDGSYFWLDTFLNPDKVQEPIENLKQVIELPVIDKAGLGLDYAPKHEYFFKKRDNPKHASKMLEVNTDGNHTSIKVKTKYKLKDFVSLTLIICAMGMIPVAILISSWGNPFFFLLAIPAILVPTGIILLIIFLMLRSFIIILKPEELQILVHFKVAFLNGLMGKNIIIPKQDLKTVRMNRLEDGHFWLALGIDQSFPLPANLDLFNLNTFHKLPANLYEDDQQVVGLWQTYSYAREGYSITYSDLLYIEQLIENTYELERSV